MAAARGMRLEVYIVLSLLSGLRTEEARALRWDHVAAWVAGLLPRQATFALFSNAVRSRAFWGSPLPSSAIQVV